MRLMAGEENALILSSTPIWVKPEVRDHGNVTAVSAG